MIRPAIISGVVCLCFLLAGCTAPLSDFNGSYATVLIVDIKPDCEVAEGYYQRKEPLLDYICLSSHNGNEWQELWSHEAEHLFRNMVGLKQPDGHTVLITAPNKWAAE